jgi:glyoxylase-like metal-dependent hydrolase (beta-lactamase superfamily II)/ferredoxin
MANPKKRVSKNMPGDFFVDTSCINCGNCRELAPSIFGDMGPYAYVKAQPSTPEERHQALQALLACPTASIGSEKGGAAAVMGDFPMFVEEDVYYCGFNSEKSYGGNSYFIRHSNSNWLIDSPRFVSHLVKRFEEMGGIKYIFLTHQDDVADSDKYAKHFSAQRMIHEEDRKAVPDAEIVITSNEPMILKDITIIPVPGHTRGHCVLLYKNKFLFTGDHLEWDSEKGALGAYPDFCWYDWEEQTRSMERLFDYSFEWVLPGHGHRVKLDPDRMKMEISALVDRMRHSDKKGPRHRPSVL